MPMYRKIPVVVEARQFDGTAESGAALVAWLLEQGAQGEYHPFLADHFRGDPKVYVAHPDPFMRIVTLEGTMVASRADWIIRGVKGEFYPCKPDIFAATYEPAPAVAVPQPTPEACEHGQTKRDEDEIEAAMADDRNDDAWLEDRGLL